MENNIQNPVIEAPTHKSGFNRFNESLKEFFTSFSNMIKLIVEFLFGWFYRPLFALINKLVEKSPNFIKRIIYGGAGTSYDAVQRFRITCEEQARQQVFISTNSTYKYIGFAILTISILTFFSTTLLFLLNDVSMNLHLFQLPKGFVDFIHKFWSKAGDQVYINFIWLPGVLAAVLVYNMDALIVRSTNAVYKLLSTKSKKAQKYIFITSTVIRIVASIALSQLINGPLEVMIAGDAITEFQARELAVQTRRITEAAEDKIALVNKERQALRQNILNAYQKAENETINSDRPGYGSRAKALKDMADATKASAELEMAKFDAREASIIAERDTKIIQVRREQGKGYFAKRDALGRLADENSIIYWMMLIIAIVLSAWELAPIFTKLIMDRTALDLMVEVEAKQMKDWRNSIIMTPDEQIQEFIETEYETSRKTAEKMLDDFEKMVDKTTKIQNKLGIEMDEEKKIQYTNNLHRIIDTWFNRIMDHKTMEYGKVSSPPNTITTDEDLSSTSAATT